MSKSSRRSPLTVGMPDRWSTSSSATVEKVAAPSDGSSRFPVNDPPPDVSTREF